MAAPGTSEDTHAPDRQQLGTQIAPKKPRRRLVKQSKTAGHLGGNLCSLSALCVEQIPRG